MGCGHGGGPEVGQGSPQLAGEVRLDGIPVAHVWHQRDVTGFLPACGHIWATYMLRCRPQKFLLQPAEDGHRVISQVVIAENNQALDCRFVVSNLDLIPTTPRQDIHISRALLLVDRQFHPDTIIDFTVIPPGRFGNAHPIHVIHSDSNAGSAPEGKRRTPLPNFLSCSSSSFSS